MTITTDLRDVTYCLRKAEEYRVKARDTDHRRLKYVFMSASRGYYSLAKENAARNSKFIAAFESKRTTRGWRSFSY